LRASATSLSYQAMDRWRTTLRELPAEARLHASADAASGRTSARIHTIVAYGALAIIAAVVFGTVTALPF
jgi:hypothetical protein